MGDSIELPSKSLNDSRILVKIPQSVFGKRVTIQAHDIKKPKRGRDILDGHECDQTHAMGDVKFFARVKDSSRI